MSETLSRAVKEELVEDFNAVVAKAEQFLKPVSEAADAQGGALRRQVERNLRFAKDRLRDVEDVVAGKTLAGARVADAFVHEHPWRTLGAGAVVGVMAGVLIVTLLHRR